MITDQLVVLHADDSAPQQGMLVANDAGLQVHVKDGAPQPVVPRANDGAPQTHMTHRQRKRHKHKRHATETETDTDADTGTTQAAVRVYKCGKTVDRTEWCGRYDATAVNMCKVERQCAKDWAKNCDTLLQRAKLWTSCSTFRKIGSAEV